MISRGSSAGSGRKACPSCSRTKQAVSGSGQHAAPVRHGSQRTDRNSWNIGKDLYRTAIQMGRSAHCRRSRRLSPHFARSPFLSGRNLMDGVF